MTSVLWDYQTHAQIPFKKVVRELKSALMQVSSQGTCKDQCTRVVVSAVDRVEGA